MMKFELVDRIECLFVDIRRRWSYVAWQALSAIRLVERFPSLHSAISPCQVINLFKATHKSGDSSNLSYLGEPQFFRPVPILRSSCLLSSKPTLFSYEYSYHSR